MLQTNELLQSTIIEKDEYIRSLELEIASKKQSQDSMKSLRDEISRGKVRVSQLELEVQSRDHSIDDLNNQMKLLKKRDELNLEKIKKLQLQVEELKDQEL